ncbi:hypothetical protein MFLAVUS_010295 [Mucor flavus]|uniref:CCHC-type domain-containing protein n=1 Tax=Mucor flavus TaxID=439312 RepID=A0ABP9ZCB8_9FUNG
MESPVLSDVLKAAYVYEGNREEGVTLNNHTRVLPEEIDDPMDLSVAEKREFLYAMRAFRGNFRGSSRGSFRGSNYRGSNFRGGYTSSRGGDTHRGYHQTRGGNVNNRGRGSIKCYNCQGFGHIAKDCASPRSRDINYMESEKDVTQCGK